MIPITKYKRLFERWYNPLVKQLDTFTDDQLRQQQNQCLQLMALSHPNDYPACAVCEIISVACDCILELRREAGRGDSHQSLSE